METTIELKSETFNDFLRCLSNFIGVCNDIDIRNGVVRQRSNDNTSIFELDMTSLIEDSTLLITSIKDKLDLLKTFQGHDVYLTITDLTYKFSDEYSMIEFRNPSVANEFMENEFVPEEELNSIFTVSDEDLIFNVNLPTVVTERIKIITQNFNVFSIQMNFNGEQASISSKTPSGDQFAKFMDDIELNMILEDMSSNVSTIPFKIDHDTDIQFEAYKDPNHNIALSKLSTTLGNANIVIYVRSQIMQD